MPGIPCHNAELPLRIPQFLHFLFGAKPSCVALSTFLLKQDFFSQTYRICANCIHSVYTKSIMWLLAWPFKWILFSFVDPRHYCKVIKQTTKKWSLKCELRTLPGLQEIQFGTCLSTILKNHTNILLQKKLHSDSEYRDVYKTCKYCPVSAYTDR